MRRHSKVLADIKPRTDLAPTLRKKLSEVFAFFAVHHVAERIESEVLSDEDRQRLGDDYTTTNLVRVYAFANGRTFERAMLDLAMEGSVIGVGEHRRLRRQIGEPIEERDDLPRPHWDRNAGKLFYRGEVIRKVSRLGTDIRLILDAFQDANWETRIDNPLPGGPKSKKLRDAIDSLKEGLKGITFFADGTATGILWRRTTKTVAPALTGASRRI